MAEIVTTRDGDEVLVRWTCPSCGQAQDDSVHPEYGPWCGCTCGACEKTFYCEEGLSAVDKAAWDRARDEAVKMDATSEGRADG